MRYTLRGATLRKCNLKRKKDYESLSTRRFVSLSDPSLGAILASLALITLWRNTDSAITIAALIELKHVDTFVN